MVPAEHHDHRLISDRGAMAMSLLYRVLARRSTHEHTVSVLLMITKEMIIVVVLQKRRKQRRLRSWTL